MNNKTILCIFFIFIFIIAESSSFYSAGNFSSIFLFTGKNNITLNISNQLFVKELVRLNPTISVVAYEENNNSIGYVNAFGGIGENFVIKNNLTYEITSNSDIVLIVPEN
jgi:hypothetical protein